MDVSQRLLLCVQGGVKVAAEDDVEVEEEPGDIIEAVEESKDTGDHRQIHTILNNRNINLRTNIRESGTKKTILRKLLTDAVNGDKIVEEQLDKSVKQVGKNENCIDYGTEIDFEGIVMAGSGRQTRVVKELLDLRAANCQEGGQREAYNRLLAHPVMATFIHLKWRKTRWYFYINSAVFIVFLALYTAIIWRMFSRPEIFCPQIQSQMNSNSEGPTGVVFLPEEARETCLQSRRDFYKTPQPKVFLDWDGGFLIAESLFLTSLVLLVLVELYQLAVLGLQYVRELENLVEWTVLGSAIVTVWAEHMAMETHSRDSAVVRGIAGVGISAAWLELIFIIGRYPFRGGDFSIMFYNIIKKTFRYLGAMALMVFGFAFGFMVIDYGHEKEIFPNPLKSGMMTLTMVLGEFNFGDMYESFGDDTISRGFAMALLLLMIILGTISMINLFIAVIVSDLGALREEVFLQSLVNRATSSILVEAMLPSRLLRHMMVEERVTLCGHSLCGPPCTALRGALVGGPQDWRSIREGVAGILARREEEGGRRSSGPSCGIRAPIFKILSV